MCYKTAIIYPDGTWSVVATSTTAKNCDRSHKFYERYCVNQLLKARGRDFLFYMHRVSYLADLVGFHGRMFQAAFPQFGSVRPRFESCCCDSDHRYLFSVVSFYVAGHDL